MRQAAARPCRRGRLINHAGSRGRYQPPPTGRCHEQTHSDKAEVTVEYQDKPISGLEQTARFDAHLDETGICSAFTASGAEAIRSHAFPLCLFADILRDLAKPYLPCRRPTAHRRAEGQRRSTSLDAAGDKDDLADGAGSEVILLHVTDQRSRCGVI
jgi:hypothetical protein